MVRSDALVPMQTGTLENLAVPGVFIAVDMSGPNGSVFRQIVGTFVTWENRPRRLVLSLPDDQAIIFIPEALVLRGYWAPAGYRPQKG